MAQITANFSDRDSANLTLMRLRRSGIDFDLVRLSSQPGSQAVSSGSFYLSRSTPLEALGAIPADSIPTQMQLSVKASHLEKAWDVLRSTGAKDIRSRN